MTPKAVIFDLDGTLLDTLSDLTYAVNVTLENRGYPTRTSSEVRSFIGDGAEMLIRRALPTGCEDAEVKSKTPEARNIQSEARASVAMSFKSELDLRGMNSDEAWEATDKYLDNATLIGVKSVRIIHGKGTGVLRRTIWERLKADKRVKDFRLGVYGEGDGGVTVAELK
jgi:phosphoglycolate phosphatase-like HAD superfamily hydrolase